MNLTRLTLVLVVLAPFLARSAFAQGLPIDFQDEVTLTTRTIQLIGAITLLSIAPGLAIMVTCFPFIVTVLSILRQAIGLQQAPPNMLIVSLALFLTYFVMDPVFQEAWAKGLGPLTDGLIEVEEAFPLTIEPFRIFMAARLDEETFQALEQLRNIAEPLPPAQSPLSILIPSFMLSEIERAFQIGFLIFLPFLIIDLVVAAILMSMGMMMVPPAVISLPFKLAFFAIADGWSLISTALVRSYFN